MLRRISEVICYYCYENSVFYSGILLVRRGSSKSSTYYNDIAYDYSFFNSHCECLIHEYLEELKEEFEEITLERK